MREAFEALIRACRGRNGVCLMCAAPLSCFHDRGCPVEVAIKVLEPAYGRHADEAAFRSETVLSVTNDSISASLPPTGTTTVLATTNKSVTLP